jgi:glyoxylase-like metal-dependent hydrolase (beta-lactamase superfamily II)
MPDFRIGIVPVTVFQQNCSLIWESDTMRAAVVDPGGEPGKILDAISRLGLKVELILLTHGHLDHAGGAKALKGELDAARGDEGPVPLLGPDARDAFLLDGIEEAQKQFGMQGMRNVRPDRFLTEGEVVALGRLHFDVLHVPGHTPGHVAFIEKARRIGFTGDTVFKGSVGRTDFPYGDGPGLIAGIRAKLLPLGDDLVFVPGHGPASTIGEERAENPFLQA